MTVEWGPSGGRSEPGRVEVLGTTRPVSAEVLRRLPLGTLFVEMQRHAEEYFRHLSTVPAPGGAGRFVLEDAPVDDLPFRQIFRDASVAFGAQRGKRLSDDVLNRVAEAYRAAYGQRLPVNQAVAEATNCSPSTAGKRIMKARKAGLLDGIGRTR